MYARSLLLTQLDSFKQELARVKQCIEADYVDVKLRQRVGVRFENLLAEQRNATEIVKSMAGGGEPLPDCWEKFRRIQAECKPLFRECLSFIQGALARKAGIDYGLCEIADALLIHLSERSDVPWRRFTILAEEEFYLSTAEIIRLRFPDSSIWNLPTAAHEFGHFVGPELKKDLGSRFQYPFQEMLAQANQNPPELWPHKSKDWYYLHEQFADVFATAALGPSFACTMILLRLDPTLAYTEDFTHPSAAKRVHAMLWTLGEMNEAEPGVWKPYRGVIDRLRNVWRESLQAVDQSESLPDAEAVTLETRIRELYNLLRSRIPSVIYTIEQWRQAEKQAEELKLEKEAAPARRLPEATLRDVLNAAWLRRLACDPDLYKISQIGERTRRIINDGMNLDQILTLF